MWTFPELLGPSVFLASPGDLADLRQAVVREWARLRVADDYGIALYACEADKARGYDDDSPAQLQIPRPDDPHCKAILCLFGERIGTPLPDGFPLDDALDGLNVRDESLEYRLVHPWKAGAAEQGGFALTGTVFEYLAVLAGKRRRPADLGGSGLAVEIFLRFVGDETIKDPYVEPGKANWDARRLRKAGSERFKDDEDGLFQWLSDYRDQLLQLRNFVRYLRSEGHEVQVVADAGDACTQIRHFLEGKLFLRFAPGDHDPFKGLGIYDVEDEGVFFGRETECREAVAKFLALWEDPDKLNAFAIMGGSGAGKSSFLRAGMMAVLRKRHDHGRFLDCVLRPGDLLPPAALLDAPPLPEDAPSLALRRLLLRAFERIARERPAGSDLTAELAGLGTDFDGTRSGQRPEFAVRRLCKALNDFADGVHLLVGLDQFEELIDQRGDAKAGPFWQPVAEFLAVAARSGRIGILYTLQPNRDALMRADPILGALRVDGAEQGLDFPLQCLDEIIRKPFGAKSSIQIAPSLVGALRQAIETFKNQEGSGSIQGSLLPLVSLTLHRIHERRARPLLEALRDRRRKQDSESDDDLSEGFIEAADPSGHGSDAADHDSAIVTLTPENCADYLKIEDAIAELAEEAMKKAQAAAGPDWSETTLGDLFRRLVELRENERYGLTYAAMPTAPAARKLAEALSAQRLLLREPDGRIRLVHQAVLDHWQQAERWLEAERPLLRDAGILQRNASEWDNDEQRSRAFLLKCSRLDVDRAARILTEWYDLLVDPAALAHEESKAVLRDFSLELLFAHPSPSRIVERNPRRPTHLMIAASYGRADMVRRYIELEPGSVHLPRADQRTAIFWPCFLGNETILDMFIEQHANVEQADENGWRPVHAVATGGHVECLRRLLKAGATLESSATPEQTTPLHLAARNGHPEMVRYLIDVCGAAPSLTDARKWTPLHTAASFGQPASVLALHRSGADLGATLDYGWTPLHLAAQEDHGAVVEALVQAGADVDARLRNEWTPLHVAARNGRVSGTRVLLASGADAGAVAVNDWAKEDLVTKKIRERDASKRKVHNDVFDWQPLHVAADANHAGVVAVLIDGGAKPDARTAGGETALHLAARKGHVKVIAPLAAAGADLQSRNAGSHTPLQVALDEDQYDFAAALVKSGADVDATQTAKGIARTDTWTALHGAAYEAKAERAAFLLNLGANPDARDAEERTPLHLAAAKGAGAVVERLLDHEAGVDTTARDGTTAMHVACLAGHRDIVERLLSRGVAIDRPAGNNVTPLHPAARAGAVDVVDFLLARQHRVDCADRDGWTPLHVAAQQGAAEVVRRLLVAQPDPNAPATRPAMTPLQIAAEVGHTGVVDALLAAGCDTAWASAMRGPAIALALRLVRHGERLDRTDPVSGQSLVQLYLQARRRRAPAAAKPAGAAGKREDGRLGNVADYPWSDVPPEVIASLVERLDLVDGRYRVSAATTAFARCTLPWCAGYSLYRLNDSSWVKPKLNLYYLASPDGNVYRRNGTSSPIHQANTKAPIALDERTVLDYLCFFCFFVRGDEGPFYLAESIDDPMLPDDPVVRRVFAGTLRPANLEGRNHQGHYRCDAVVYYSNALFTANFAVQPGGMVEMLNDEPIVGDLPGKIDAPLA